MLALLATFVLLPNAHAHNDYVHPRPLLDALDQGFLSVEADIFLVDGKLLVAHNRQDVKASRTLEALYLDPLAARVKKNKGTVYGQPGTLTLLIDLKESGERLQPELAKHLEKYRAILSDRKGETVHQRAIQVILTGARTEDCAENDGFFFKDGTRRNLADETFRTPQISDSYPEALGTDASPLTAAGKAKLLELVRIAHGTGKRVRLWEAPDGPTTWKELRDAKVDLINTDKLAELRKFLVKKGS